MERIFHLKENGTTVKTEILAGLTTFMTMAYIIALNPQSAHRLPDRDAPVERRISRHLHRLRHWHGVHGLPGQQAFVMAPGMA